MCHVTSCLHFYAKGVCVGILRQRSTRDSYRFNSELNGEGIVRSQIDGNNLADGGQAHLLGIIIVHVVKPVNNARIPGRIAAVAIQVLAVT